MAVPVAAGKAASQQLPHEEGKVCQRGLIAHVRVLNTVRVPSGALAALSRASHVGGRGPV
jgi:hypothetical protein